MEASSDCSEHCDGCSRGEMESHRDSVYTRVECWGEKRCNDNRKDDISLSLTVFDDYTFFSFYTYVYFIFFT